MGDALTTLIDALADLFDGEGRPGGDEVAAALRHHRDDPVCHPGSGTAIDQEIRNLCAEPDATSIAHLTAAAWHFLPWHYSGLSDGRIPEELARRMITCEILGDRGTIFCSTCRVGFFAQMSGVDYGARTHAAEETFFVVAGEADFRLPPGDWHRLRPGDAIHHPSMAPHQSRSPDRAMLAVWRWTGSIGLETYQMQK